MSKSDARGRLALAQLLRRTGHALGEIDRIEKAQEPDIDQVHFMLIHLALHENHYPVLINSMPSIAIIA
jgi:hypothetical protein